MFFKECVDASQNQYELKRFAGAYVEDCKRLTVDEIKAALLKTEGQYLSLENVTRRLEEFKLDDNPVIRIVTPIFLKTLLDKDEFLSPCKETENEILAYEQTVIDDSNNFDQKSITRDLALFKFVLDKSWEKEDSISVDEKNLIEELRKYLHITTYEQNMLEAKSNRFPTKGNVLHSRSEIDSVRKALQGAGILFYIKDADGVPCDVLSEETVQCVRQYYGIEIRSYGYRALISYVSKIRKKQYLLDIISKFNENPNTSIIEVPAASNIATLQELIFTSIKPSNLICGFSARDGLDIAELQTWCSKLSLQVSGSKAVLTKRILDYYDQLREIKANTDDEREQYYHYYHELACRDLATLRKNEVITKDLECEHYFEKATNFLFEQLLRNKPLNMTGSEHADGKLSFNDKYILWDNKSKESPVNLKDHIQQFDGYIRNSDKPVSVFMVIGPDFTENSIKECVKYSLTSDTLILLITADELKNVAEKWDKMHPTESFNLGFFKQNGRFDISKVLF